MKRTKSSDRLLPAPTDASVDEGLWEVAAMVYVGDVYAVMLTDQADMGSAAVDAAPTDEALWPFIR